MFEKYSPQKESFDFRLSRMPDLSVLNDAKLEQMAQGETTLFLDEAGYFIDGKPSAELQAVIDKLEERGVQVMIITSNNPNNLETTELRDVITAEYGFGMYSNETLAPRAIICIFNNRTTDQQREVICATGNAYEGIFSQAEMMRGTDLIIEGILNGDADQGYENAYSYFNQVFETHDAQEAAEAAQPTMSVIPENTVTVASDAPPAGPSFYEQHRGAINGAGITTAIIGVLAGVNVITQPRRTFVAETERKRRGAMAEYTKLTASEGNALTLFNQVESILLESYPDQAKISREERDIFVQRLEALKKKADQLNGVKVGFFRSREGMQQAQNISEPVRQEALTLLGEVSEKLTQSEDLQARLDTARANTDVARTKLAEMETWYEERYQAFNHVLPSKEAALNGITAQFKEAEQNTYYDTKLALRGSDQAVEVSKLLAQFQLAVESFTHAYEVSQALLNDAAQELQSWPDQAIQPIQVASAGVKLLDEAKAGISIPAEMVRVVELSDGAEQQFKFAKDYASGSATVLKLQDENNQAIAAITGRGFWDRHIEGFRSKAAKALSQGNLAASQGEWSSAQGKLGEFRTHINDGLAEMRRLEDVYEQTDKDLDNMATHVEEAKHEYGGEVTRAWEDLQQNFSSENFDETAPIWKVLRKGLTDKETIDFSGHYVLIGEILTKLTDSPDDKRDAASKARGKNSLEVQEFDVAAALVRKMEKELADAHRLMDGLVERQKLARQAESDYKGAITNAHARLRAAEESIDTKDEDRLVDTTVDEAIKNGRELVALAEQAGKSLVFVAALEAASKASDISIRARKSAEDQIRILKEKYTELEEKKKITSKGAKAIIEEVEKEADAVITSATISAQRALEKALVEASNSEKKLGALEDHVLGAGIGTLIGELSGADRLAQALDNALDVDRRTYQELVNQLDRAISAAGTAISNAESRCSHSYSGSAGDSHLASARLEKPSKASWGDERKDIEAKIKKANAAKQSAEQAYALASAAIAAEEARLAAIERARQQKIAEENAKRAREAAESARRANEAAQAIRTANNSAGKKF